MEEENKKNTPEYWSKIISSGALIISWIIYFSLRNKSEAKGLIWIPLVITIISAIGYFGYSIYKKIKEVENKDKEPISKEEIKEIIKDTQDTLFNNLRIQTPIEDPRTKTIKKNIIYRAKLNYNLDNESKIIIINLHAPELGPTLLDGDTSESIIRREMNDKALDPEDSPDIETTVMENAMTGNKQVIKRKIHKPKVIKQKEENVA